MALSKLSGDIGKISSQNVYICLFQSGDIRELHFFIFHGSIIIWRKTGNKQNIVKLLSTYDLYSDMIYMFNDLCLKFYNLSGSASLSQVIACWRALNPIIFKLWSLNQNMLFPIYIICTKVDKISAIMDKNLLISL